MSPEMQTALWRWVKIFLSGVVAAVLVSLFANTQLLTDVTRLNFTPEVRTALAQIVTTAVLAGLAKYFNVTIGTKP